MESANGVALPRVTLPKAEPIPAETLDRAAAVLRILAHPVRLRLVEILLMEPVPVHELAERTDQAPAAISQHLNSMRAHGILDARRDGRAVYYEVVSPNAGFLIDCIRRNGVRTG